MIRTRPLALADKTVFLAFCLGLLAFAAWTTLVASSHADELGPEAAVAFVDEADAR